MLKFFDIEQVNEWKIGCTQKACDIGSPLRYNAPSPANPYGPRGLSYPFGLLWQKY
jgi:hypothetical protein